MERSPRVAVLLMDGMWAHDVANTIQVFGDGTPLRGAVPCEFAFVSDTELVRLDHGLSARATTLEAYGPMPDLVCVPGFVDPLPNLDAAPVQLAICADWLSRAHNAPRSPRSEAAPSSLRPQACSAGSSAPSTTHSSMTSGRCSRRPGFAQTRY